MRGAVKKTHKRGKQRQSESCATDWVFVKVLGFPLEAHLENLRVEPYDVWVGGQCTDSQGFVFSLWCW